MRRVKEKELERDGALRHFLVPSATVYKTEGFAQRDFSEAPKFTQPLVDCTTVIGYDTQLFCCVRASPKVSGEVCAWLGCVAFCLLRNILTKTFIPVIFTAH